VLASAIDSKGLAIKDLTKADWIVKEDGAVRTLSEAKPATEPLEIILLVENSKWLLATVPDVSAGVAAFAAAIAAGSPDSTVELMGIAGQLKTIQFATKDPAAMAAVFNRTNLNPAGTDVMLEALVDASSRLAQSPTRRRAIVIFHLEGTAENTQLLPSDVVPIIVRSGATVWAISLRSEAETAGAGERDGVLSSIMPLLGGERTNINTSKAIAFQMKRIAQILLGQYELVYTRPSGPTPKQVAFSIARPGAKAYGPKTPPGAAVKVAANADEAAKHNKRQGVLEGMFKDGDAALTAGKFDDALAKFTAVTAENDRCAACFARIGEIYLRKTDYPKAEQNLLKAIELDPKAPDSYTVLASVYRRTQRLDDAAKMSAKGNELRGAAGGADANAIFNQGVIFFQLNKFPEAQAQFEKAVQLDPKMADAHFRLGVSLVSQGKLPEAKKPLEEYLKLDPTGKFAKDAKDLLAAIK
jgi:tetratricopeptide (TPR) repeat protein